MYGSLRFSEKDRILIVAPHPDDETLGCGGLLALFGPQCDVLLLTDGRKGVPSDGSKTEEETAVIRRAEFDAAAALFGVSHATALDLGDSCLRENAGAVSSFDLRCYHTILIPYRLDRHPDHAAANRIIRRLYKKQRCKAELLEYEVWSPVASPNRFLDISGVMDQKLDGVRLYASQVKELDYESLVIGLNGYRGAPHHVRYCEAFFSEKAFQMERRQRIFERLPLWLRKLLLCVRR